MTRWLLMFLLLFARPAFSTDVRLTWTANTESDLAGYKAYYGSAPRTYGPALEVGNQTSFTVTGLTPGTWYFAVAAYDTSGNLSGYSAEAQKVIAEEPPPPPPPANFSGHVLSQYNIWYTTPSSCPASFPTSAWSHWAWWSEPNDPCTFLGGTNWLRDATTLTYPLIGPYRSNREDVFRWQIKVAKASGMTGFLVTTNPYAGAESDAHIANFLIMLKVASEEGFKLGLDTSAPSPTDAARADFYARVKSHFDQAMASPYNGAFLRINGFPVVWVRLWGNWDSLPNVKANLIDQRNAYWMMDGDLSFSQLASLGSPSRVTQMVTFNFPSTSGCVYYGGPTYVSNQVAQLHSNGYLAVSHGYPGFNEALMSHEAGRNPPRTCTRNGTLAELFQQSASADFVLIESWNDHGENTMMEPGIDIGQWRNVGQEAVYSGDPYKLVKQIADFKGVSFVAPQLDCSIVDPVLNGVVPCVGSFPTVPPPTPPRCKGKGCNNKGGN